MSKDAYDGEANQVALRDSGVHVLCEAWPLHIAGGRHSECVGGVHGGKQPGLRLVSVNRLAGASAPSCLLSSSYPLLVKSVASLPLIDC